jgi:DNA-binding NtrC family response regulator/tetratricopeptide (TPR) repeat protein
MIDAAQRAGQALARIAALTEGGDRNPDADSELAELYLSIDRYDDALAALKRRASSSTGTPREPSLALSEAWCRFHLGDLREAARCLDGIASDTSVEGALAGRAQTLRSWILLERGEIGEALAAAHDALSLLRQATDHRAYGDALLALGRVHLRSGRVEDALGEFRDALATFRRAENLSGMGRALHDMAVAEKSLGRLAAAEDGCRAALDIAEQLGQRRFLMTRRHSLAILLFHKGQWRASRRLAEAALHEAVALGDAFVEVCTRISCARALVVGGEEDEQAQALLERARSLAGARGFAREEALAHEFLGDLARARGDWALAEACWRRALAIGERIAPHGDVSGEPLRRLAEARLAAGDLRGGLDFARRAYAVTRRCGDRREQLVTLRVLGQIAAACGRARAAWGAYQASVRGLEAIGARTELAHALVALGRHLVEGGSESDAAYGREVIERAAALFEAGDLRAGAAAARGAIPVDERSRVAAEPAQRPGARRAARSDAPARTLSVRGVRGRREIVTRDPAFIELLERITVVARGGGAILLLGETGTGKELLARLAHEASGRRGRFVAANAAGFPEGLVESELFGHVRGAFTGAIEDKAGLIESADGGTFFLDEVGDLPPAVQVKLLRVLDETVVKRVGALEGRAVDVRFVAATNRDLKGLVRDERFRRDLYYRLSVHEMPIPPLRERRGDVALLAAHLIARLAARDRVLAPALSPDALAALEAYAWPGNVRELESEMERAFVRAREAGEVRLSHLSPWVAAPVEPVGDARVLRGEVAAIERMRIREALDRSGGNTARAAHSLGMTRQALRYKIQKYGLVVERSRSSGQTRR